MGLKFTDPEVEKNYETDKTTDPIVHLPGGKDKNGWKGRLSTVPLAQVERWIKRPGQSLFRKKDTQVAKIEKKKNDQDQLN